MSATRRHVILTHALLALQFLGHAEVATAQSRVVVTAEGGVDQPIGRWGRQTRSGPVAMVAVETGDTRSAAAFLATFAYSHLESKPYRSSVLQGDLETWGLTLGASRRTSSSRPVSALVTFAAGVVVVEEAGYSVGHVRIDAQTNWAPALSAGLGAEFRRASIQVRLRTELWVHPLTYSPDAYGSPAAVRSTLGIGFVREPASRERRIKNQRSLSAAKNRHTAVSSSLGERKAIAHSSHEWEGRAGNAPLPAR